MRMCVAQRIRGDLEQAVEGPIHLQYEEYGAPNRQCTNEEDRHNHGVPRANKPKLANVIVSQNRRTARNSVGTDDPVPVMRSHLPCNSASKRSSARDWSARCESLCGFKSRIAAASRSAPNTVSELIGSRLAGLAEPCGQNRVDSGPHGALQTLANLASLGPVASKYAVESEDLSR